MKCVICKKGVEHVGALFRINQKGVPGLWACRKHLSQTDASPIPPEVDNIAKILTK